MVGLLIRINIDFFCLLCFFRGILAQKVLTIGQLMLKILDGTEELGPRTKLFDPHTNNVLHVQHGDGLHVQLLPTEDRDELGQIELS